MTPTRKPLSSGADVRRSFLLELGELHVAELQLSELQSGELHVIERVSA